MLYQEMMILTKLKNLNLPQYLKKAIWIKLNKYKSLSLCLKVRNKMDGSK